MLVDFHSHTLESDGTLAPADLAAAMRARGVGTFAITDHDSLEAFAKLGDAAGDCRVVTGIELNTTYRDNEVHILGFGFPLEAPELRELVAENRAKRVERVDAMLAGLARAGVTLDAAAVRAEAGHTRSALGRPHVARALVRAGYVPDMRAAFARFLTSGKPGYVPSTYLLPHEAVRVVARSGGVPVLAHPGRLRDDTIVADLVRAGLLGIEVFYPTHTPAQIAHYRAVAARYDLVMTAGSDFHDVRHTPQGVGMDVERDDIAGFLDLIGVP